jgi:hypothetical protein
MEETIMRWRKSSFSGGDNGDCIELAWAGAVRDSKNPNGGRIEIPLGGLLAAVKAGSLTH